MWSHTSVFHYRLVSVAEVGSPPFPPLSLLFSPPVYHKQNRTTETNQPMLPLIYIFAKTNLRYDHLVNVSMNVLMHQQGPGEGEAVSTPMQRAGTPRFKTHPCHSFFLSQTGCNSELD